MVGSSPRCKVNRSDACSAFGHAPMRKDSLALAFVCADCAYGNGLHTAGVTGSIPVAPTILFNDLAPIKAVPLGAFAPGGLPFRVPFAVYPTTAWRGTMDWKPIETAPEGVVVKTKIDDADGCRNETTLKRDGNLWWFPDGSMYVYYRPTHWRNASA